MKEELRLLIPKTIDTQFGKHVYKIILKEEDITILEDREKGTFHIEKEEIGGDKKVKAIVLKIEVGKRKMDKKTKFDQKKYL